VLNRLPRSALERAAQARLELLRRKSKDDLFIFTKEVLGYNLLEVKPHKEVCDFLLDAEMVTLIQRLGREKLPDDAPTKKKLLMLPRSTFKSTISTIAFPLKALALNPELSIMIDNETYKNGKKFLSEIKGHIANNTMLKQVLTTEQGSYLLEPNESIPGGWTEDSIILKARTRPRKEPSLFCSGVDTAATGMHPHIIIMDDLVSERTVNTDEQLEKTKQHYRFAFSLLEPGGILIVIGTRYHLFDLYAEILDDPSFDIMVRPAILENGEPFFPSRLGIAKLNELKQTQGIYIFNSQYMLNPLSSDNAVFKPEWFKFYEDGDLPERMNLFITVDLAISQKESADYTVIVLSGVDPDSNIYLIEMRRGRFTPNETADHIFDLYEKYNKGRNPVLKVGVESVAFQKAMIYFLKDEMRRRGRFLPLQELRPDKDKTRRAQSLQPWVENGAFFLPKSWENGELHREMLEFPFGRHDDCVDAVSYIPQILRKPGRGDRTKSRIPAYKPRNPVTGY